jgi:signal transduction histidine kinase
MSPENVQLLHERTVQIVCADRLLARSYGRELERGGEPYRLWAASSPAEARLQSARLEPDVILFDQSAAAGEDSLEPVVALLTEAAPVVVVAATERQAELAFLITSGAADFVARGENSASIAAGLVERRLRLADAAARAIPFPGGGAAGEFGEILRHEVNNPLTGILGNAELLLARRNRLPPAVVERLETIAELAVRLRETVRRLSDAWEERHDDPVRSA